MTKAKAIIKIIIITTPPIPSPIAKAFDDFLVAGGEDSSREVSGGMKLVTHTLFFVS